MRRFEGFTLVELLVVITIMASLMVVLLPQFNNFQKSQTLKNAAQDLQTHLRKAQNNAASGAKCNSTTPAASWSIKFTNTTSYELETTCSNPAVSPAPTPSLVTEHSLPNGININSFIKDDDEVHPCEIILASNPVRIIFSNISAEVNFDDSSGCLLGNAQKLAIALQLDSDTENPVSVIIEKGGSVYVRSE